ncbi:MAG: hypothetical protein RR855_17065 [Comamonas sp.]
METIIVYLDDAEYAQPLLQSMAQAPRAADTHWVVVACAPRITHRVSKWVSNRARENWRTKWADKLFAASLPLLQNSGAQVTSLLARGPLAEVVDQLRQELGTSPQIVDLRRPKLEAHAPAAVPVALPQGKLQTGRALPAVLAAMATCLGVFLEEALI